MPKKLVVFDNEDEIQTLLDSVQVPYTDLRFAEAEAAQLWPVRRGANGDEWRGTEIVDDWIIRDETERADWLRWIKRADRHLTYDKVHPASEYLRLLRLVDIRLATTICNLASDAEDGEKPASLCDRRKPILTRQSRRWASGFSTRIKSGFRVHPDPAFRLDPVALITVREGQKNVTYIVEPAMQEELIGEFYKGALYVTINRQGTLQIWPVKSL